MDDGNYTIVLTPLDKWSKYPLEAEVRVRNIPHTPVIKNISINQTNGTVSLSGTSQPNHVIHLYDNGSYYFSVTADANGKWWAYNRHFTKEKRHTVNAKAENKKRNWPTLSALSNSIVFLTYQIKAGDTLSDAASYYLGRGARWTEIKNSTGIKDEKRIYAGNWLLVMNPLREGPYNKPGKIEPNDKNNKNGEGQKSFADPVNSVTGNYYTLQRDLFIPGRGLPFEFTRTYNSQSDYRGHLGFRWDFNLSRSLIFYNDGSIGHKRGDGGIDLYTSDNQGNFVSPAGVYDALKARGDGTYHITQKDRREYKFDSAGYLVGIVDRNGNTISLQYNEDGQLAQVNDTVGRQIRFIYDEEQRITAIIDPQNRKGSYHYDANGDLVAVTCRFQSYLTV